MKNELEILRKEENNKNKNINNLQQNLYILENEIKKMKSDKNNNDIENKKIRNDKDELIARYEMRIKKIKEEYENKIFYLEDINEKQNKKLTMMENKAFEMVKNQQLITEKYKNELSNAINYYEGVINNVSSGKEGNISNNNFA